MSAYDEKITAENCPNNNLRRYLTEHPNCYAISLCKYKKPVYQKGHFYWDSYWAKPYEVLRVSKQKIKGDYYIFTILNNVTVRWLNNDKINTHSNPLLCKDYELIFE